MLVLSRKQGQSIIIDNNVTITVLSSNDGRVRLGITAPEDVSVHREEVQRVVDEEEQKVVKTEHREAS